MFPFRDMTIRIFTAISCLLTPHSPQTFEVSGVIFWTYVINISHNLSSPNVKYFYYNKNWLYFFTLPLKGDLYWFVLLIWFLTKYL